MTTPRQRPGRSSPPLTSREAALVGALTAFAKAPAAAAGAGHNKTNPTHATATRAGRTAASNAPRPSTGTKPAIPVKPATATTPNRPVRHDSGTVAAITSKASREAIDDASREVVAKIQTPGTKPTPEKKQKTPQKRQSKPVTPSATPGSSSGAVAGDGLDESRLPSTSSLVQLFEQQGTTKAAISRDTPLKSPKAVRHPLILRQDDQTVSSKATYLEYSVETGSSPDEAPLSGRSGKTDQSSTGSFISARDAFSPVGQHRVSSPTPASRERAATTSISERLALPLRESHTGHSAPEVHVHTTGPERRPSPALHQYAAELSPYAHSSAATSTASITATYNALHPRRLSALKTNDSLANAIVASSLASSRAPSPTPTKLHPPVPLIQRRSHHSLFSRTPSPHKLPPPPHHHQPTMRHTLRTAKSSDSDSDEGDPYAKHKRKRHIRRHANKYAEGDRKRWRNVVTARERARYEGVWAANRGPVVGASEGAAHPPSSPDETVHALAVKSIWARSRLPAHVLEEVWELVDGSRTARLSREEFVVGLWLVDQRLRGRKLPTRVGESVWESVRVVRGIRLRMGKGK